MRVFKNYAPKQIAKYVVAFFKGQFSIEGQGVFEFDAGRVVVKVKMDEASKKGQYDTFLDSLNDKRGA